MGPRTHIWVCWHLDIRQAPRAAEQPFSGVDEVVLQSLSKPSNYGFLARQCWQGAPPLPLSGGRGSRLVPLGPDRAGLPKCDALASNISITWDCARNADSRAYPRPLESETLGMEPAVCYNKPSM